MAPADFDRLTTLPDDGELIRARARVTSAVPPSCGGGSLETACELWLELSPDDNGTFRDLSKRQVDAVDALAIASGSLPDVRTLGAVGVRSVASGAEGRDAGKPCTDPEFPQCGASFVTFRMMLPRSLLTFRLRLGAGASSIEWNFPVSVSLCAHRFFGKIAVLFSGKSQHRNSMKRKINQFVLQRTSLPSEWIPIMKVEANNLFAIDCKARMKPDTFDEDGKQPAGVLTEAATEVLEGRLSLTCDHKQDDPSVEMSELTRALFHSLKTAGGKLEDFDNSTTGAITLNVPGEKCLSLYIDLVQRLTLSGDVTSPVVTLEGPSHNYSGGFGATGYAAVNVKEKEFAMVQQKSCIFAMPNKSKAMGVSKHVKSVMESVQRYAEDSLGFALSPTQVHFCFGFNEHAHFTFHQDDQGEYTVVVQLSPGNSSIQIADRDEIKLVGPGSGALFLGNAFHRSGTKQRRTLTVSFFFNVKKGGSSKEADETSDEEDDKDQKPSVTPPKGGSTSVKDVPEACASPRPADEANDEKALKQPEFSAASSAE